MYAHQVINDLHTRVLSINKHTNDTTPFKRGMSQMIEYIPKAKKFHLGNGWDLSKMFSKVLDPNDRVFMEHAEYCRLPYDLCWFDYRMPSIGEEVEEEWHKTEKRGVLVEQSDPNLLWVNVFSWYKEQGWLMTPVTYFFSIGTEITKSIPLMKTMKEMLGVKTFKLLRLALKKRARNMFPLPLIPTLSPKKVDKIAYEDKHDFSIIHLAMMYLNCNNVVEKKVDPPEKLQKKRKKSNKPPMFSYHILEIEPPKRGKRKNNPGDEENKGNIPLHECRGHFKLFTADKPLFGKYTGLYWWDNYWRGNAEKGVVFKDYQFKGA